MKRGEVQALRKVVEAARQMPRRTPAGGAASTPHPFILFAYQVWGLDTALRDLDLVLGKTKAKTGKLGADDV